MTTPKSYGNKRFEEGMRKAEEGPTMSLFIHNKLILEARREALEEAQEIADEHNGCVDTKCLSESNCGATIANQIRALIGEETK
jgi:hypothetical protein